MREQLELDEGLVLALPNDNEQYGTDNIALVGRYAARALAKLKKYAADDKFQIGERFGIFRLTMQGIRTGRKVDFKQIRRELSDLSQRELESLAGSIAAEYNKHSHDADIGEYGAMELLDKFIANQETFCDFLEFQGV